jgi:hypothetical protein
MFGWTGDGVDVGGELLLVLEVGGLALELGRDVELDDENGDAVVDAVATWGPLTQYLVGLLVTLRDP